MAHPILRRILGTALILLAAASIYLSWGALYEFALASGFPPERAIVFPIVLDVVTVCSALLAIFVREGRVFSWVVLVLFGFATVAGNALHVTTLDQTVIGVPLVVAICAASIPPLALILTVHLAAMTAFRPQATTVVAPVTDRRSEVTALYESGHSLAHIARETNVARSTVVRWIKAA
jgi:hypothetical protein